MTVPEATARPQPAGVTAVVPLRDGVSGKSRLSTSLDPAARRRLVVALARHVLGVLAASDHVDRVVVVTADAGFAREVLSGVPGPAVEVLAEPAGRPGLNAALEHARDELSATAPAGPDAGRMLVVHADLPLLGDADVDAVVSAHADVVVATDRHGTGTNLLGVPVGADLRFRFGARSRAAHEAEATRHGLHCAVVLRAGTAADLDTIDDVVELPAPVRTRLGV
ncbi:MULTISPECIES: 2-phospho-L-lactate guanylyltransferase [unclassified Isoptericola]|uniref:2-phospho-L-lactate guanylyltransferase n=1 Tax=unclassified Isoptericola TaxID=2623355 RepID=UPI002712BE17|nr:MULTISPECIES: 2-phospho-L-lactate guanylyltransferase [unclassified Isoptericola]MDO8145536.1 2-phospho-L-lactate guanylyltransferase [Isoptericola sp. 178]MDO8152207.1 2-phospho-L-lactate guanylyltransferase [Isoptericola sp. b408]